MGCSTHFGTGDAHRITDLRGKTALVTGSTNGIGLGDGHALAARGAQVLIVGRDEQRAKEVVAEIEGGGGRAQFRLTTWSEDVDRRSTNNRGVSM